MDATTVIVYVTIATALLFAVINGLNDAASSIATIVSTRVLAPRYAVLWAAAFNFLALFVFQEGVAATMAGVVRITPGDPGFVYVLLCGLVAALVWNLVTWRLGVVSSSFHALLGGLAGAGIAYAGPDVLDMTRLYPIIALLALAPVIGLALGVVLTIAVSWLFRRARPRSVDRTFRIGQVMSTALYSLAHGANSAQKTVGVIIAVLIAGGRLATDGTASPTEPIPSWIEYASYGCLAAGTALGGWRVVRSTTVGLTSLKPVGGFCAEVACAVTLLGATNASVPVSTTHTITGAVVGVGSVTKISGIRWVVASRIIWAWIITIPMAGLAGAACLGAARALHAW